jgi:hypothetical protein
MFGLRSTSVNERSLGLGGTQSYIDDKTMTTLITPRIERIKAGGLQLPRFMFTLQFLLCCSIHFYVYAAAFISIPSGRSLRPLKIRVG